MDEDNALPAHVVALFRDLGCVLEDARDRLDALLLDAIPRQDDDIRARLADPGTGGL